jgi:arylsulfatase A-like enzyme
MPITRRHFFFGSLALPAFAGKQPPPRPNVLLFLPDRLPAWILGCYGNKEVQTPNIDRLSQSGTRFLNHFVSTPEPQASRATFLTGAIPAQGASGDAGLDKVLGGLGYNVQNGDASQAASFLGNQSAGKPFFYIAGYSKLSAPYDGIAQKYRDLYRDTKFDGYAADPPAPNAASGKEMLGDIVGNVRRFAAGVTELDDHVGAAIAQIRNRGLVDNTLIVFTSTCGSLLGRHGLWDSGDASDPVNMYDEAIATPMLWSWAGRVPAIAMQVELIASYDFAPTICEAVAAPQSNGLRGISYLLMATGKPFPKRTRWREAVCGAYKNTEMARVERYKWIGRTDGKGPNELYDLTNDPHERVNQADNEQYVATKNTLVAEIAKWKAGGEPAQSGHGSKKKKK